LNGDSSFREILGVSAEATREQIRQAYRLRVMENHPDRFPPERKPFQELTTIALTEAYTTLMRGIGDDRRGAQRSPGAAAAPAAPAPRPQETQATGTAADAAPAAGLMRPRDPAYAWYKQGFINFSLAIHGMAAVNRKIAASRSLPSRRRFNTAEYFGTSLAYLRTAHGYFTRVVEEYAGSPWVADSRFKLRRIEGLTAVYRRILRNVRFR
jgi:hypothetical protein